LARTREDLRDKYQEEIDARKQGLDREGGRLTVQEFLGKKFLPFYRSEVEQQTWADYRLHIETNISPLLGPTALDRLSTRDVDQWVVKLRQKISDRTGKALSHRTVEYALAVLRRAMQFAVDWRYIAINPASARMRAAKRRRR